MYLSTCFWSGTYMLENLQSFYNCLSKGHSMFSMSSPQIICQNCENSAIRYLTKLQLLLRGQLNRCKYIFDLNRLDCCLNHDLLIVLTETLLFWYLTSKHCHGNTVNVLCHVLAGSFPPCRDFCNSP